MRAWFRPAACGPLVAAVLLAAGCGLSTGRPAGKVTYLGQPAAGASIAFVSEASPDAPVTGVVKEDGTYVLDFGRRGGVPAGKCKVTISYFTLKNGKPLPGGEEGAALKTQPEKVAQHVFSFEKDVPSGPSALDFELTQGKREESE